MNVDVSLSPSKSHWAVFSTATGYPIVMLPVSKTDISKEAGKVIFKFGKLVYRIKPSTLNTIGGSSPGPTTPETYMAALVAAINN